MKKHLFVSRWLAVVALCVLFVSMPAAATTLTSGQMYFDPANMTQTFDSDSLISLNPGTSYSFAGVTGLKVLPPLLSGSDGYYLTPNVDYSGDIDFVSGAGAITFTTGAVYFVEAQYTDRSVVTAFAVGTRFRGLGGVVTKQRTMDPPPGGDVVIVDPSSGMADPPANYGGDPLVKTDLNNWEDVVAYMETLTNAHVELDGHGSPGNFYWNGVSVLNKDSGATLDKLKGHVNNLTFISCSTASGCTLVSLAADKLGASAGYTATISDDPDTGEWYINDGGYRKAIPEPVTMLGVFMGVSGLAAYIRRRRPAQA
jgi:hypothetical protein